MSNPLNLEIQGPQYISGTGSTTFEFSDTVTSCVFGFSKINAEQEDSVEDMQDFTLQLWTNGANGSTVTVNQTVGGFVPDETYSYVTCLATVGSTPEGVTLANSAKMPLGSSALVTSSIGGPPALCLGVLSGFGLQFTDDTDLDGIGAGVGVTMVPSGTPEIMLVGNGSLIGDEQAAASNTVSGGLICISAAALAAGGFNGTMVATAGQTNIWEWLLSNSTPATPGLFLQSFYFQWPIAFGLGGGPWFQSITAGGSNPTISSGGLAVTAYLNGYVNYGERHSPNQQPATYQTANYVCLAAAT
ncbi:MAG: hypothetical protein JOZ86_00485 [Candidatus Eremiobacteraeota bacterium]|nr:hypothetical protein [Candidatus Eremiobacteraeota bacterium]